MTKADDVTWLHAEAVWLRSLDTVLQPAVGNSLTTMAGTLAIALPKLTADWTAAGQLDTGGPDSISNAIKALGATFVAVYSGGSGTATRLQDDATRFDAIASRLDSTGTATQADVDWLTAEAVYFTGLDAAFTSSDPAVGLQAAVDGTAPIRSAAVSNSDSGGVVTLDVFGVFVTKALNALYSRGPSTGPNMDSIKLKAVIIPDLQALVPTVVIHEPPIHLPPLPGPLPAPVNKPGSLTTPAPASSGSNMTTLIVGAVAVAGVGWLAWYVATHRRAQVPVRARTRRR